MGKDPRVRRGRDIRRRLPQHELASLVNTVNQIDQVRTNCLEQRRSAIQPEDLAPLYPVPNCRAF
jgi:hypothetical protein